MSTRSPRSDVGKVPRSGPGLAWTSYPLRSTWRRSRWTASLRATTVLDPARGRSNQVSCIPEPSRSRPTVQSLIAAASPSGSLNSQFRSMNLPTRLEAAFKFLTGRRYHTQMNGDSTKGIEDIVRRNVAALRSKANLTQQALADEMLLRGIAWTA